VLEALLIIEAEKTVRHTLAAVRLLPHSTSLPYQGRHVHA
jgi:hypothetical protein